MKQKKEIITVSGGDECQESKPCFHEITIQYSDGTEEKKWSNGADIARRYMYYMNFGDKMHFSEYARFGFFSALFATKPAEEEQYLKQIKQI